MFLSATLLLIAFAVSSLAWYARSTRRRGAGIILRGVVSAPIRLWSSTPERHRAQNAAVIDPELTSNQTVLPGEAPS